MSTTAGFPPLAGGYVGLSPIFPVLPPLVKVFPLCGSGGALGLVAGFALGLALAGTFLAFGFLVMPDVFILAIVDQGLTFPCSRIHLPSHFSLNLLKRNLLASLPPRSRID